MKRACVYILASKERGTLYVGVTSDLGRRLMEHQTDAIEGFTKRYGIHMLVYAEFHDTMPIAIARKSRSRSGGDPGKLG